jgi:hypothetical protein
MSSLKIDRLLDKFTKCCNRLPIFSLIPLRGESEAFYLQVLIFTIVLHDFKNYNYHDLLPLLISIYFRMWFLQAVLFHMFPLLSV